MDICIADIQGSYSDRWINYCLRNGIPYKTVNCRDSDIIDQLEDCRGLLWHWQQSDYRAALFAKQLTFSLAKKGIKLFPDINTSWHYDDKVGQKYLLEAINAPLVKSYVFYSKNDALQWVKTTSFPKVFKLRCGAGSMNVRLVKNKTQARRLVRTAFKNGFPLVDPIERLKERFWILKRDRNLEALKLFAGGIARFILPKEKEKFGSREKGYIYFQDYVHDNLYDTRISVVGDRCFGAVRYCRKNDFRASGSGLLSFDPGLVDIRMVKLAFATAGKLKTQSLNFDFLLDGGEPKIIEISYCQPVDGWDTCPGYWDRQLNWHEGRFKPQEFILKDFINSLKISRLNKTGSVEMNIS